MTLNAEAYRINLPAIVSWRLQRPDEPLVEAIGAMAVAYSVPIIVVAHYIGELEGYSDWLNSFIERLELFYGVDTVTGLR